MKKLSGPMEVLSAILVTVLVLGAGAFLDRKFGCLHFARSGAVLVLLSFVIAATRESRSKKQASSYIDERIKFLETDVKLREARAKLSDKKRQIRKMSRELSSARDSLRVAESKSTGPVTGKKILLEWAAAEAKNLRFEIKALEGKNKLINNYIDENESGQNLLRKKIKLRRHSNDELERATHVGELIAGAIGTIVWAYGDFLLGGEACLWA